MGLTKSDKSFNIPTALPLSRVGLAVLLFALFRELAVPFYCSLLKFLAGSLAEWSIAPVLKTGNLKGFQGSNP